MAYDFPQILVNGTIRYVMTIVILGKDGMEIKFTIQVFRGQLT
jgi:hypothetical protein